MKTRIFYLKYSFPLLNFRSEYLIEPGSLGTHPDFQKYYPSEPVLSSFFGCLSAETVGTESRRRHEVRSLSNWSPHWVWSPSSPMSPSSSHNLAGMFTNHNMVTVTLILQLVFDVGAGDDYSANSVTQLSRAALQRLLWLTNTTTTNYTMIERGNLSRVITAALLVAVHHPYGD